MPRLAWKVRLLVWAVSAAAAGLLWLAAAFPMSYPGALTFGAFIVFAFLLDRTGGLLGVEAKGSTSFTIHLAAGITFGDMKLIRQKALVLGNLDQKALEIAADSFSPSGE